MKYVLVLTFKDENPSVYGPFDAWIDARDYHTHIAEDLNEGDYGWAIVELYAPQVQS